MDFLLAIVDMRIPCGSILPGSRLRAKSADRIDPYQAMADYPLGLWTKRQRCSTYSAAIRAVQPIVLARRLCGRRPVGGD
jgi:hypothetical protein